jgi:hypothetical protein
MTQQLSNCCKAQATVSSSDEGTSCFMCVECKRPCDLRHQMKEQVSVDYGCDCKNCERELFNIGCEKTQKRFNKVCIKLSEYKRLKRMDENVRREIEKLEEVNKLYDDQEFDSSCPLARNINARLTFLKSLYDE